MNLRLQHVTISRPPGGDAAARTFYGNVLGLSEVAPPRSLAAFDLIWYRLAGETELRILVEQPWARTIPAGISAWPWTTSSTCGRGWMRPGVTTVGDTPIAGRPRFFVRDPFGNLIEITSIEDDYRRLEG